MARADYERAVTSTLETEFLRHFSLAAVPVKRSLILLGHQQSIISSHKRHNGLGGLML